MGQPSSVQSQILCFGDFAEFLKLNLVSLRWERMKFDYNSSAYSGNLRYTGGSLTS